MTPSNTNGDKPSLLNAQERKLPKNAKGESIAKDTTKEEKARDQRKGHFFLGFDAFLTRGNLLHPSGHHWTWKKHKTLSSSLWRTKISLHLTLQLPLSTSFLLPMNNLIWPK
jgi:hypothetical protein